jgi:cytochrome c-type biogenesis protein CcsB
MAGLEHPALVGGMVALSICIVLSAIFFFGRRALVATITADTPHAVSRRVFTPAGYAWVGITGLALLLISLSIISRIVASGHGPFSNMYEFSTAFSWGIVVMSLVFLWRYRTPVMGIIGIALALGLLIFASTLPSRVLPLVPALQQSTLLSLHVASAVIAYGALAVGFSSSTVYLITYRRSSARMPQPELLENISYRSVIIGFPFLTLTIILGAVWANTAWGRPWGWDPKETASLVTWLIFAAYLHARVLRGWRGARSASLLAIGFLAVLFTFFGNYIFSGLHSYG